MPKLWKTINKINPKEKKKYLACINQCRTIYSKKKKKGTYISINV
jgi:hypothetical protein